MKAVLIVVIACDVLAIAACSNYDNFDNFDSSGKLLVSGQTSELSRELPPGKYRIRIDALGQTLEEQLTRGRRRPVRDSAIGGFQ